MDFLISENEQLQWYAYSHKTWYKIYAILSVESPIIVIAHFQKWNNLQCWAIMWHFLQEN